MHSLAPSVLLLLIAVADGEAVIEIKTPPKSECSVRDSGREIVRGGLFGGDATWQWRARPGEILECDFENQEPRDFTAVPTSSITVKLEPARVVTLRNAAYDDITVEWLELTSDGVALRATRTFPGGDSRILVAESDRLLRVRRKGASPVSFLVPAGKDDLEIVVPPAVGGGEILAVVPQARFSPESAEVRRAGIARAAPFRMRVFLANGLAPGEYDVHTIFAGGVRYKAATVRVAEGEAATVPLLNLPSSGAALDALPSVCDRLVESDELTLHEVREGQRSAAVVRKQVGEVCSWVFHGLPAPRLFEARIRQKDQQVAAVRFSTEASVLVRALFEDPSVEVSGHVSFGGSPPGRPVLLQFAQGSRVTTTTSAPDGFYQIHLPEPGEYFVTAKGHKYLPSHFSKRTLSTGRQTLDLDFAGGALRIDLEMADGTALPYPIQLSLRGGPTPMISGFVTQEDGPVAWFFGLPSGTYRVTAEGNGYTSAAPLEVRITSDAAAENVTVTLQENRGRLRIVDENGKPITDARVVAWPRIFTAVETGIYDLRNVTPGTRIIVTAPGRVPTCQIAKSAEETVVLRNPFATGVQLLLRPTPVPNDLELTIRGVPDAECPLSSTFFEIRTEAVGDGTLLHFLNVPLGTLYVSRGGKSVRVDVPGPQQVLTLK